MAGHCAGQKVLQQQGEECQKSSLKEEQWKAAERRKETEAADWEKEQQCTGCGFGKTQKESQRSDRTEEHQRVVGKGEEEVQAHESWQQQTR